MEVEKSGDLNLRKRRDSSGIFTSVRELFGVLGRMRIRPTYFFLSIALSFCAALFSAMELALLIPLLNGIIHRDYEFVRELPVFSQITENFPEWFVAYNSLFILVVLSIFTVSLIGNLVSYLSVVCVQGQVREANSQIRKLVFNRYLSFGKLFFDRHGIGNLNTVLMSYTAAVARQLKAIQRLSGQMFALIAYTIMILMISWKLTLITLLTFPLMNYLSAMVIHRIRVMSRTHVEARKTLDKKIFNILSCIPLVKASAMEEEEKRHFADVSDREVAESFRMERMSQLITPIQNITTLLALLVVAFSLNLVLSGPNIHSTSAYLVFFFIVRRMVPGFNALNKFGLSLATASGGITPVLKIINDDSDKHIVTMGHRPFRGLQESIEFRNLNFSYYPDVGVLKDISFRVEKGKTTAIVGPTGAGKTTITSLILRFYDCSPGSIFVDGRDIREYRLDEFRNRLAYVSQDALLFNDTLRSNVMYGYTSNGRNKEEVMVEAVKKSRLGDFVAQLPRQYDTIIGERGIQLSGGEKQRVSIARALIKGADILILDEATSSLDSKTEKLIQEGIEEAIRGKTAIVIAHRLSTIRHADKILVVEGGRVAEEGELDELLEKRGKFFEYWEAQRFF